MKQLTAKCATLYLTGNIMSKKMVYLASFVLILGLAGKGWSDASNPSPEDGAIYKNTWAALSWQPGEHAVSFDIYIGDDYEDVKNGAGDTFRGNQNDTFFIVGFPYNPYPDGLEPGTTYYWRIDEVNDLHPDSPSVGDVWSFKITPLTAYAPEPNDGAEFIDPNVILSWQPGLGAKLHIVYFGDSFVKVNNATEGRFHGTTTYNPGILELGKTYYWRVDESDGINTYKGDVWSFTVGAAAPPDEGPPNTTVTNKVIYVDADAVGANNGSNWENAYLCLQDALEDVFEDIVEDLLSSTFPEEQTDYEIRVANGIYKPDRRTSEGPDGTLSITASDDQTDTFLIWDMTIKGGYAGYGEPDPNARDIDLYETVLNGDLYDNDIDVSNPRDMWEESSRTENSYHVVSSQGNSVIDGFTITGGNANDSTNDNNGNGGGLFCYRGTIQITNCKFTENSALFSGGGIYAKQGELSLTNCTFARNLAGSTGGGGIYIYRSYENEISLTNCTFIKNSTLSGEGGAVYNNESYPIMDKCTFIGNSALRGGGLSNNESSPILTNCKFIGNLADQGGGIYNLTYRWHRPDFRNCLFSGNRARSQGGGIYNYFGEPILINCTFAWNSSDKGNALYCRSDFEQNTITLYNCILWDGGNEIQTSELSIMNICYSNIQGGWSGEGNGNIDEDPLFADPDGPDDIPGTEDDDLRLAPFSPCIDSGLPNYKSEPNETDIDCNPRVIGGRVDLGAYEFQEITYIYIYVDADAVGANDGSNWENAYLCLQDALEDNLAEAQIDYEIRVAHGTYIPDRRTSEGPDGTPLITESGDRRDTFLIRNLTIKGGYAGYGEPDPNARNINLYKTILSGDLYGNDVDVSNPEDLYEESSRAENSFHVVTSLGIGNSVIDGFTITGGYANDSSTSGGGLLKSDSFNTLQITNCTFTGNSARSRGGGIYNDAGKLSLTNCAFTGNLADPGGGGGINSHYGVLNLTNCTFTGNHAGSLGGGGINGWRCTMNLTNCTFIGNSARFNSSEGGGIAIESNGQYQYLTNCTFIENSARAGGGIYSQYGSPILTNCIFRGNSIRDQGGGMCNISKSRNGESPILRNCLFTGNHSGFRGGGIYNLSCEPVLTNCTFAGNWAGEGNALYCKSDHEQNTVTLTNCILWDFGNEIQKTDLSIVNIFYSNIKGGWDGEGNIDEDPLFADPNGPDHIPGTEDDDLRLTPLSTCIDSGDPNYMSGPNETDLDGNPRIIGGRVDMGAYEFQDVIYVDNQVSDVSVQIDRIANGSKARPFNAIQGAIDIAKDGQKVLVRPGVYSNFDFMGKAITVAGTDGAAVITVPGNGQPSDPKPDAVTFHTGEGRDSVLKNFIIKDNGVAISLNYGSSPTIANLTIVDNDFGISAYENSNPDISNCIFFNNRDGDLFQCEARYSCFEIETPGTGNITGDPLFVDPNNGDYHLMSEGWRWNMQSGTWTYDAISSPCLDAGEPASPLGDEPLSAPRDLSYEYGINLRINMGAYGGTCQASIPPLGWLLQESEADGAEELAAE
jgi:parallel beta-helix repeat protein/predicted outer membrane repeat protein